MYTTHIKKRYYFRTDPISLKDIKSISFVLRLEGRETNLLLDVARLSCLNTDLKKDYTIRGNYIFTRTKRKLLINEYTDELHQTLEKRFDNELRKRDDLELKEDKVEEIIELRQLYLKNPERGRRIWIFMDRPDKADDNAEHLFRYSVRQEDGIEKYFVVSKKSSDFDRMKQYGNVVEYGSQEHKLLMMQVNQKVSLFLNKFFH